MRVYCDMDDVLCETAASLCRLAESLFGVKVAYETVREFDLQRVFALSDEQMVSFSSAAHAYETLMSYPATPEAVEGLLALQAAGHEVDIVTGRPSSAWRGTADWLSAHGLGDFPVTYVDKYSRGYASLPGEPRMVGLDELKARQYDWAIDDSPLSVEFLRDWTATKVMVFDRPWNRDCVLSAHMCRVEGWRELCRVALGMVDD